MFIINPKFLYFMVIILGISSIKNQRIIYWENSTYNITDWPVSKIID